MKTAVVLTGLLAALAISAQAIGPFDPTISVSTPIVTGATNADGSNITVTATIVLDDSTHGGQVMLCVKSTNNLVGQLWPPREVTFVVLAPGDVSATCIWTNTDETWNPYFTGDYVVTVVATDLANRTQAASSTNVTVNRTFGGTMNSVKVPVDVSATAYDVNAVFANIDTNLVFLHIPGVFLNAGAVSIPMNLMNVTNPAFASEEQMDVAFMDTGRYRTNGTPFRFDMNLHARPTSIMGFGELMCFVWTPAVATNAAGNGNLTVDILSRQPWRDGYATNFSAHVGCAPLFMTDTNVAEMMEGMIMSTTAHYMDVIPVENDVGIGLTVNGQSNKTSNLKAFLSDAMLAKWGVPVDRATNLLAGYVTHFDANTNSEGTDVALDTEFARIAAGGTNYAYNSTNGDSGYVATFTFQFQSPVAAQMGVIASVEGDFNGDGMADPYWPVKSDVLGMWTIWLTPGYTAAEPLNTPLVGGDPIRVSDFEGDGLADLAMVDFSTGNWYLWLSSSGFQTPQGPSFTIPGSADYTLAADFDGDRLADPAMVIQGNWYIWLSKTGYPTPQVPTLPLTISVPSGLGEWVAADFDGDRFADPAHVVDGDWYFYMSKGGYVESFPLYMTVSGDPMPMTGDFDCDGLADPVMVANHNWTFWFSSDFYRPWGPYAFVP